MSNSIGPLSHISSALPAGKLTGPPAAETAEKTGFQQLLTSALRDTAALQNNAQQAVQSKLAGDDITNVEVLADLRKADLALRLMLQIRNKLLEAYNEIKQMQF